MRVVEITEIKRFFRLVIHDEKMHAGFILAENEKGKLLVLGKKLSSYIEAFSIEREWCERNDKKLIKEIKERLKRRRKGNG